MSVVERTAGGRSIADTRAELECGGRHLASGGNVWDVIEYASALGAGVAAGSVALMGLGLTANSQHALDVLVCAE